MTLAGAGEDGSPEAAADGEHLHGHERVDGLMNAVQASGAAALLDRALAETEPKQLVEPEDTLAVRGEPGELGIKHD